MLYQLAHFLLKKRSRAAFLAFLCSIFPLMFAPISAVLVALITLCHGRREGFFVLAWGILPLLARAYVEKSVLMFILSAASFLLVWVMALILRRYSSWSMLLNSLAFASIGIVLSVYTLFPGDIVVWWQHHLDNYKQLLAQQDYFPVAEILPPSLLAWLAKLATSFEVFFLFFAAGMKLVAARWWQGLAFKRHIVSQELVQVRLNRWVLALTILLVLCAWVLHQPIFIDMLLPVLGFYILAGLCLLHAILRRYPYARWILFGFYSVVFLFPYTLSLMAILGLVDSGFKLREVYRGNHFIRKNP